MAEHTGKNCIFCKIVADELPHERVAASDDLYAFLDVNPISRGHTLVIPRDHFQSFESTPVKIVREMAAFVADYAPKIAQALGADGFNIGINNGAAAGQVIGHAHWHIIPRYQGDGLRSWPGNSIEKEDLNSVAEQIRKRI
ncbi:MAG: HIT family protein [Patescibacteria group bacterium]